MWSQILCATGFVTLEIDLISIQGSRGSMYDIYIYLHNIYEPHQVLKIECIIFMVFKLYSGHVKKQVIDYSHVTLIIND